MKNFPNTGSPKRRRGIKYIQLGVIKVGLTIPGANFLIMSNAVAEKTHFFHLRRNVIYTLAPAEIAMFNALIDLSLRDFYGAASAELLVRVSLLTFHPQLKNKSTNAPRLQRLTRAIVRLPEKDVRVLLKLRPETIMNIVQLPYSQMNDAIYTQAIEDMAL